MKRLSHRLRRPLIHRNQRRLSAHIPRLHPLLPRAARLVRAVATVFEPLVLASSEVVGYRPFSYRGRTIYYRVDNLTCSAIPPPTGPPGCSSISMVTTSHAPEAVCSAVILPCGPS